MDFFFKFINEWRKARRINLGLFLFAFLALIFISYLGAFNNNFLSGANTQSFFYPSVAEACSSNDYNCLECQGVNCGTYCSGYTYYYDSYCSYGACYFNSYQNNSPSCGWNNCVGVDCSSNYCSGYTYYYNGSCTNGSCFYSTQANSSSCGYVDPCATVTCDDFCSGSTLYEYGWCNYAGNCQYSTESNSSSCNCPGHGNTFYRDADGDGYGNPSVSISTETCVAPAPTGYVANNTDCDDSNSSIIPGSTRTRYQASSRPCGTTCLSETQTCSGGSWSGSYTGTSCSASTRTGYLAYSVCSPATCTTQSQTCQSDGNWSGTGIGSCSVTSATTYYRDVDGDGYGNPSVTTSSCSQPAGYVADNTDCNDNNASVWQLIWGYNDADGDGYGVNPYHQICSGASLPSGYSTYGVDCNDSSASIYPGTTQTQSCTVTSTCSNTCTGSQTNICYADGTYTAWSACGGCTPASCDPCAGVTCPDCCGTGTYNNWVYYYNGYCSGGSCSYDNTGTPSIECGWDPCSIVSCPDYCDGYTRHTSGYCDANGGSVGTCYYPISGSVPNSPSCGYVDPCAGVSCDSPWCNGYEYVYGGYCSGGSCYYSYEENSSSCSYPGVPSTVSSVTTKETNGGGGLSTTWSSVGASGYRVYVKGGRTNPTMRF